jgi:hypothetical protein
LLLPFYWLILKELELEERKYEECEGEFEIRERVRVECKGDDILLSVIEREREK